MLSQKSKGTKVPTLSQAYNIYYRRRLNGLSSAGDYLKQMKMITNIIGDKPVSKITAKDINKLIDYLIQKQRKQQLRKQQLKKTISNCQSRVG